MKRLGPEILVATSGPVTEHLPRLHLAVGTHVVVRVSPGLHLDICDRYLLIARC